MTALLTGIDEIRDDGPEIGKSCYGLHLNCVSFLHWVVKDTWCVYNLDEIELIKNQFSEDPTFTYISVWSKIFLSKVVIQPNSQIRMISIVVRLGY